jgi:methane monooxygenase component D
MKEFFANIKSVTPLPYPGNDEKFTKLYDAGPYAAFCEDLEFMWRWTIYRDQQLVQEGCSLTLDASRRAVEHVMAFFTMSASGAGQGVQSE